DFLDKSGYHNSIFDSEHLGGKFRISYSKMTTASTSLNFTRTSSRIFSVSSLTGMAGTRSKKSESPPPDLDWRAAIIGLTSTSVQPSGVQKLILSTTTSH